MFVVCTFKLTDSKLLVLLNYLLLHICISLPCSEIKKLESWIFESEPWSKVTFSCPWPGFEALANKIGRNRKVAPWECNFTPGEQYVWWWNFNIANLYKSYFSLATIFKRLIPVRMKHSAFPISRWNLRKRIQNCFACCLHRYGNMFLSRPGPIDGFNVFQFSNKKLVSSLWQ